MNRGLLGYPLGRGHMQRSGLGWPQYKLRIRPKLEGTPGTYGVAPAAGLANVKGVYGLVGRPTYTAEGFFINVWCITSAVADFLFDFAVGDGQERVIVSNLLFNLGLNPGASMTDIYIPMRVDAGQPLYMRCQCSDSSLNGAAFGVNFARGEPYASMRALRSETYGANTVDSGGVSVDPGAVADTKGAWTEITSVTIDPIKYLLFCIGGQNNATRADAGHQFDLGYGQPGSEQIVVEAMYVRQNAGIDGLTPSIRGRWVNIPAGVRLVARQQSSSTDATDRLADVSVVGFW